MMQPWTITTTSAGVTVHCESECWILICDEQHYYNAPYRHFTGHTEIGAQHVEVFSTEKAVWDYIEQNSLVYKEIETEEIDGY
jgi:hypothetical protein